MNEELYQLAEKLEGLLFAKELKLVTAESCTGGLVSAAITAVSGSSICFDRGFVTYGIESKTEVLGVDPKILANHGAVSEDTARAMADGALLKSNGRAQVSLAITGIAGPGGGTVEKPVGMVCFGWKFCALPTASTTQYFNGSREEIRLQAAKFILQQVISLC